MKLIAAGSGQLSDGTSYSELCSRFGIRKLLSHYGELKDIEQYNQNDVLMVDSGGHIYNKASGLNVVGFHSSKPPRDPYHECDRYFRFLVKNRNKIWVMVEPDFYGQLPVKYVDEFCQKVQDLNPTFQYIRVYHPGIPGNDDKEHSMLRKWIDEGHDYIGISKSAENCFGSIFQITHDKIKLHGFALTGSSYLENYPFYSADSTSALVVPVKYHSYNLGNGKRLSREEALKTKDIRVLLQPNKDLMILESLKQQKKYENHLTKLWERRGIKWQD